MSLRVTHGLFIDADGFFLMMGKQVANEKKKKPKRFPTLKSARRNSPDCCSSVNHFDVDLNCVRVITDPHSAIGGGRLFGGGGLGCPLGIHVLPNVRRAGSC